MKFKNERKTIRFAIEQNKVKNFDFKDIINQHLLKGKKVSIVSPELHGRDYFVFWNLLKTSNFHLKDDIMLCTDLPLDAQNFFYG